MYITTQENGIINPDNYPRIDVYSDADTYVLCAFTERSPDQSDPKQRITIAVYNEKVDADYALIHLYASLNMGEKTWDSKNAPLLSEAWDEVKQKFSNDQQASKLIKDAFLNIALPDQLIIKIPYGRVPDDSEIDFIMSQIGKIVPELVNLLQKNTVYPVGTFNVQIITKEK